MTTRDFTANVISATKVVPDGNFKDSKASGIWDINEALDLIKGGNWPNVANFNPAAFVDGLFSTFIHDGGSAQDIVNGIDLTKGGLVWSKARDYALDHGLFDSENSNFGSYLSSNDNGASTSLSGHVTPNNNGFSLSSLGSAPANASGTNYVSWTFRKQPKFFDIVTYTGTGSARTVAHNLGSVPGMIMVKVTSTSDSWALYHRGSNGGTNPEDYMLRLNTNDYAADNADYWNDTAPTDSVFTIGTDPGVNGDGVSYVAYLFAHNNDDGGFGEPGDQDIIKCGYYTGNGSTTGPVIDLGFEPQWIMFKRASGGTANWGIIDTMRGMVTSGDDAVLFPDDIGEELGINVLEATPTGFQIKRASVFENNNNDTYVYMAIRRGGMQTPTAASDVFAVNIRSSSDGEGKYTSGFPVDFSLANNYDAEGNTFAGTRLTNTHLQTNATVVEASSATDYEWDHNDGVSIGVDGFFGGSTNNINWMWKRARGYFDVVAYTGNGQNGQQIKHNLGVAPELTFIKNRGTTANWLTLFYAGELANNEGWQSTQAFEDASSYMSSSFPNQATYFGASANSNAGASSNNYIAYLFATAAGVSKVGSFTQSGATNVACGFTGDTPALIILKRTDSTGNWYLFDSARGIVAGNDKSLYLNTTAAEVTNADIVDPYSGGFATTSSLTNGSYIFYAIASIA